MLLQEEVETMLPPKTVIKVMLPLSSIQRSWYQRLLLNHTQLIDRLEKQTNQDVGILSEDVMSNLKVDEYMKEY